MNRFFKVLSVAALTLGLDVGVVGNAEADQKLTCDMSGKWMPDNDNFAFVASYIVKNGPDVFSGVYTNASAGAVAKVEGAANNGTWTILLTYTDAAHKGYVKTLVGTGTRAPNNTITIKGDFTAKKNAAVVQKGSFTMNGKCK